MISVIHDHQIRYPDDSEFFSPSQNYPEYPFSHIASRPNLVYHAVRNCLAQAGLDKANYGKPSWNPLRYTISEGSNVFVLCNFVYHMRPNELLSDFFAKCTHGSVLRAVLDYVILAVGENGIVRFGNAPIQSCDWDKVLEETGATKVVEFYNNFTRYLVNPCDLRSYIVKRHLLGGITVVDKKGAQDDVNIDIGKDSLLEDLFTSTNVPEFRSLDYDPKLTRTYHGQNKHIYVFNKNILEADTVVGIPKLKTHEKVGVTLGIKNCVGGIAHKHCLAHFRLGSPDRGGDEYENGQLMNRLESKMEEFTNTRTHSTCSNYFRTMTFFLRKFIHYILGRNVGGGWVGNDTTWRMSMDIVRILKHSDKTGKLCGSERRKIIGFIDGIVSGEGNGPLTPTARHCGFLSYSDDLVPGDYIGACFMGLKPEDLPIIRQAFSLSAFPLTNQAIAEIRAIVNGEVYDRRMLQSLNITPFKLPAGWGT